MWTGKEKEKGERGRKEKERRKENGQNEKRLKEWGKREREVKRGQGDRQGKRKKEREREGKRGKEAERQGKRGKEAENHMFGFISSDKPWTEEQYHEYRCFSTKSNILHILWKIWNNTWQLPKKRHERYPVSICAFYA